MRASTIATLAWVLGLSERALSTDDVITEDTYFYGQSEPVYPTREL
jgi:hypothetical protein